MYYHIFDSCYKIFCGNWKIKYDNLKRNRIPSRNSSSDMLVKCSDISYSQYNCQNENENQDKVCSRNSLEEAVSKVELDSRVVPTGT